MSRRFRQAFVETICRRRQTQDRHVPDITHHPQMSAQRSTFAIARRSHHSFATEMLPHHQQQHQQQLLKGTVYVDAAGKLTTPQ